MIEELMKRRSFTSTANISRITNNPAKRPQTGQGGISESEKLTMSSTRPINAYGTAILILRITDGGYRRWVSRIASFSNNLMKPQGSDILPYRDGDPASIINRSSLTPSPLQ